jgi:hypothetical protein
MGDDAMRAVFLLMVLLMSAGLEPLLAQDQRPSAPSVSPPAPTTAPANRNGAKTLERMGPGIDWDHRKPGRHWKIIPGHKGADATPDQG